MLGILIRNTASSEMASASVTYATCTGIYGLSLIRQELPHSCQASKEAQHGALALASRTREPEDIWEKALENTYQGWLWK